MKAGEMLPEMEVVPKRELYLYVDLECCGCGRLCAMSNMVHTSHHYYCRRCSEQEVSNGKNERINL